MFSKRRRIIILAASSIAVIFSLLVITLIGAMPAPRLRIVPRDYESIQDAINDALESDIIYVKAGVYRESLLINKSLILIGEDPRKTLLDGETRDYTVLIEKAENVIIAGFTVTGGGVVIGVEGRGAGVQIYNSSRVLVLQNHFTGNRMAIYVHTSSRVLIADNIIYGNREGIYLTRSNRVVIYGNTLMDNPHFGIHLTSSRANKILRNMIIGGANGIYLYNEADHNEVSENIVKGGGMLILDSSYNVIKDNVFTDRGIFVSNSRANIVSGNQVNGEPIIYLEGASGEVIERAGQVILVSCENITISGISISDVNVGIELWKTNNSRVINGMLRGGDIAIFIHSSSGNEILNSTITSNLIGLLLSSSHNNMISNNVFASNLFGIALRDSQENVISDNLISESASSGILLVNSSRNVISGNVFRNNSRDLISAD